MSRGYPIVTPALEVDAQVVSNAWMLFTPQILNMGAGATPNYLTNSGRFMVANNNVRCDILLSGDGGTPGSGAGQLAISLPVLPSALRLTGFLDSMGYSLNNANFSKLAATLSPTSPFMLMSMWATASSIANLTGADQNNATRTIRLHFWYEADELPP
jgi:hypothetical protein